MYKNKHVIDTRRVKMWQNDVLMLILFKTLKTNMKLFHQIISSITKDSEKETNSFSKQQEK